ncbi:MAG: hypothetical protein EOM03_11090 [Clostridia bacterium]|nr:hypothetical protein [Clostridia bacterium]
MRPAGVGIHRIQVIYEEIRLCSLSEFMRSFKQSFGRYFNKKHNRKGYFWGDRYKSLIVEEGHTLINLLAYIDLNPIRAGIVKKPEDYCTAAKIQNPQFRATKLSFFERSVAPARRDFSS